MPRLSQFYGIAIYMYYRDHAPPHFHAIYGEHEATFRIATGTVLAGRLPRRARRWSRIGWRRTGRSCSRIGTWRPPVSRCFPSRR